MLCWQRVAPSTRVTQINLALIKSKLAKEDSTVINSKREAISQNFALKEFSPQLICLTKQITD